MRNEKKKPQPKAIIQLDKLVFSCVSTVQDNFNYAVEDNPNYYFETEFQFNRTKLIRFQDPNKRFKHSFNVIYNDKKIGSVDFKMHGAIFDNLIRFTVFNETFYNNTLKHIPNVLEDLNLAVSNFNKIDIAIDCYDYDIEKVLRQNLRDKDNSVKLFNSTIQNRNKVIKEIVFCNHGSLNNSFKIRSILIKNKKRTYELSCYNKTEEIKQSGKEYINNYHKDHNPKFTKLYRIEIRLTYEEIRRYMKKHKRLISFDDVANPQFQYNMFSEYLDRIIVIYKNGASKRKREKIHLLPTLEIVPSQGILQPTLPTPISATQYTNLKRLINNIDSYNEYKYEKYKQELFIDRINNNINKYINQLI
uniref:hypothetical protein n=1 Tax=uncultured Dysgonomonas sp. TaxID=206096 RepID=UPI002617B69D|nr:hypothetical protein [uncultured Dysgonomonas sp.]